MTQITANPQRNKLSNYAWHAVLVLAVLVLIARSGWSIRTYNHTIDEPYHIASAVAIYQTGHHVMAVQHGPLPRLVAGLPLHFANVTGPISDPNKIRGEEASYLFGDEVLFRGTVPYWKVLTLSRWAMLLVFPPVCLLYVFLLGKLLGGSGTAGARVGAIAALFFSLDPTLLGHSFWVCTDVAAAAGFLAALYHGLRWIGRPTLGTALAAGVALGLAISCKFSCLLVAPGIVIVALLGGRRAVDESQAPAKLQVAKLTTQLGAIAIAAFVALWSTYLFAVGRMSNQDVLDAGTWKHIPHVFTHMLLPMPSFFLGLVYLIRHDKVGHASYLNGHVGHAAHWFYFPEAIALKEPLAVLLAVALAAVVLIAFDRRRWRTAAVVLVPAGLFLLAAMKGNLNLGIRHVLPVIPCLYLFVSLVLLRPKTSGSTSLNWKPIALAALMVIACIETIPATPDYISYFNFAAGGSKGGQRYLLDSNLDWGQDVARLADVLHSRRFAEREYTVHPFDVDPKDLLVAMGLRPESMLETPHGLFAISVNVKHGLLAYHFTSPDKSADPTANPNWTRIYPLVARVGTSIEIYDLDKQIVVVDGR